MKLAKCPMCKRKPRKWRNIFGELVSVESGCGLHARDEEAWNALAEMAAKARAFDRVAAEAVREWHGFDKLAEERAKAGLT